ncbi:TetR/AcrR family transcriptional regulator [Comamonas sp. Y6]|uniref:TetR/AcrR family transcriptional regulator n=1 Tax=Comamonas resistens TaxID=3046670 RepID=A0ABY8SQI4_9BURK|nr:TetR/AcrR family transcriptional regulator [Comamonas resistens]MDL5035779.1 TetR/AcrR family transcriptional regulator [Comamonas resistens]WHS65193.1 TetR/AcrR family transcriptional regulator [Comamonas resistens]HBP0979021.1 TetR/AcrR family transcriptional regulator [Pseudomonas aeruginosa]
MAYRPKNLSGATRRKPQQSRSRHTAGALQEAFVQLLVTRDYDAVTIRDITDLAGTSLGSFYEYFGNKDNLAKVSVHLRSKRLLRVLQDESLVSIRMPLDKAMHAAVDQLLEAHRESPPLWGVHYLLERRFSGIDPYAKMYEQFVGAWQRLIMMASDRSCPWPQDVARTCHTIIYGLFAHAHLQGLGTTGACIDYDQLRLQSRHALLGYLALATPPSGQQRSISMRGTRLPIERPEDDQKPFPRPHHP